MKTSELPPTSAHFPVLGPFLYDVDNERITVFQYREIDVSNFKQGTTEESYPVSGKRFRKKKRWWGYEYSYTRHEEKPLKHDVVYGNLRIFDGTWVDYIDRSAQFGSSDVTWTSQLSRILAMSPSGELYDYAKVYALGSSQAYIAIDPLYTTERFKDIAHTPDGIVEYQEWIEGSFISIHYSTNNVLTLTPMMSPVINRNDDGTFTYCFRRRRLHGDQLIEDKVISSDYQAIAISPILTSIGSYGSETFSATGGLHSLLHEQLDSVAGMSPRHHQFKACQNAVEGMRTTQVNGISFMKELTEIKTLFEPFIEMLVERKWFSPKAWAGILLSIRYGWRLSIKDWIDLYNNLKKIVVCHKSIEDYRKFRNSLHTCYGTYKEDLDHPLGVIKSRSNCRLVLRWELPAKTELDAIMGLIEDMGLRLTLANLWDMIPFSFVVDWFTGIGAPLAAWDMNLELDRLRLRERVSSLRNRLVSNEFQYYELFNLVGRLTFDTYTRSVSKEFPKISYERDSPSFRKHTWEMFLLFLANGRGK
jgi:hypothetical protein